MDRDPDQKEPLMAVEPKLSDQEIMSLMEILHPTRQWLCHCALPASLPDRRRRPPFPAASYETGH